MDSNTETKNEKRRKMLYDMFSKNLSEVLSSIGAKINKEDAYVCPICLKIFTRDALKSNIYDDELTLEDAPPQHLRGKKIVLTCKICNNDIGGGTIDHHLGKKLIFDEFKAGNTSIKTSYKFNDDINIKGKIQLDGSNNMEFVFNPKSNPYRSPDLKKLFESEEKINFNFSIQTPNIRLAATAALKSAYLMAFAKFGYGFIFNKEVKKLSTGEYFRRDILKILDQIKKPSEEILPNLGVIRDNFPDEFLGLNLVCYPEKFRAILVVFDIINKKDDDQKQRLGVFLPAPITNSMSLYSELADKVRKREGLNDLKIMILNNSSVNLNEHPTLWINDIWVKAMNAN